MGRQGPFPEILRYDVRMIGSDGRKFREDEKSSETDEQGVPSIVCPYGCVKLVNLDSASHSNGLVF